MHDYRVIISTIIAVIINHHLIENLLKQNKLINRTDYSNAVCPLQCESVKLFSISHIRCSMFDVRSISGHVYMQLRV